MFAEQESNDRQPADDLSPRSDSPNRYRAARDLAQQIEVLLGDERAREPYGVRLARALAADLADQLAKMANDSDST